MSKTSNKHKTTNKGKISQTNKNNKKMPENLMKKQYLESFKEMKQELKYDSNWLFSYSKRSLFLYLLFPSEGGVWSIYDKKEIL